VPPATAPHTAGMPTSSLQPHNSNPRPVNAAALLKHEDAATSAAGVLAFDQF